MSNSPFDHGLPKKHFNILQDAVEKFRSEGETTSYGGEEEHHYLTASPEEVSNGP